MKKMRIQPDTKNLPQEVGIYILKNKRDNVIYIGKSTNIRNRVRTHLKNDSWHAVPSLPNPLAAETTKIDYIVTENEAWALIKESELIKKYKPRYNIMLRDDKQYFYVGFSKDKLPVLTITHQPKSLEIRNSKLEIPPSRMAGPFTDGKSIKTVLRYLRKVFPYYSQKHRKLPCSYCHIGLCPGPDPDAAQYKKNITKIKAILNGKKPRVISSLKKEMAQLAKGQDFEKAARARDQIRALENIFSHNIPREGYYPLAGFLTTDRQASPSGQSLKIKNLKLKIATLEAYDISNIQGKEPVASMVRFDNGKPNKSLYRKFKIMLPGTPNDVAMIKEVIRRRLSHPEWPYPNTMLIDGGRGQLNGALREISRSETANKIKVIALAKRFNELYVPGKKRPIPLDSLPTDTKNILMYARDEAHRFAIAYHRKLHRKNQGG